MNSWVVVNGMGLFGELAKAGDNCRMFQPSQHDVRRFFCDADRKQREALPLSAMEAMAADWIAEQPKDEKKDK